MAINKKIKTMLLLSVLALIVMSHSSLSPYLRLDFIQANLHNLQEDFRLHPFRSLSTYFITYIFMIILSLPGSVFLMLAGGAIFGPVYGTLVVSFAGTLGAGIVFLTTRFFLADYFEKKFCDRLARINHYLKEDGTYYLLSLRLIPIFPYSVVNIAMALTSVKLWHFLWVSQIGILPASILYTNAGLALSQISSPKDIFSLKIIVSLFCIGLLPLVAKKILRPKSA